MKLIDLMKFVNSHLEKSEIEEAQITIAYEHNDTIGIDSISIVRKLDVDNDETVCLNIDVS